MQLVRICAAQVLPMCCYQHILAHGSTAGVIRQEDGCIAYDVSYGADESVNFHETWSSIRTMLRSIYVYPTVARVFFSERFRNLSQNHTVEGPFMVTHHSLCSAVPLPLPLACSSSLQRAC